MKNIVILGSTGSIGRQTLDVIRAHPGEFKVVGLSSHANGDLFARQVVEFSPRVTVQTALVKEPRDELSALATLAEADIIVNALSGFIGLWPTYAALKAGKKVVLANKEALVMAGELLMPLVSQYGGAILPIDSEPSAIWQALGGDLKKNADVEKIILTASGGPFWGHDAAALKNVTPHAALAHPTWRMGSKVTIDSATLMNKAFEVIESAWLFDVPPEKIDIIIHRQSVVHSFVQFCDGNIVAVLFQQDMRIPISYALFHPQRTPTKLERLDITSSLMTFEKPDYSIFEGPRLAYEVLREGGSMPAIFCLADEIAVEKFMRDEIPFLGIYDFIKYVLGKVKKEKLSMELLAELPRHIASL